jgi:hypothetical protein
MDDTRVRKLVYGCTAIGRSVVSPETNTHEDGTGLDGLYPVTAADAFCRGLNIFRFRNIWRRLSQSM